MCSLTTLQVCGKPHKAFMAKANTTGLQNYWRDKGSEGGTHTKE